MVQENQTEPTHPRYTKLRNYHSRDKAIEIFEAEQKNAISLPFFKYYCAFDECRELNYTSKRSGSSSRYIKNKLCKKCRKLDISMILNKGLFSRI